MPVTPPLWTPAQQSWLQAMGYTVFVDGSVEAAAPEPAIDLTAVPTDARTRRDPVEPALARLAEPPNRPDRHVEPGLARLASPPDQPDRNVEPGLARLATPSDRPASRAEPGSTRATPPSVVETATPPRPGTRRPAVRLPDRLQIALLRASGCNPNDPDTQALMASWNLDQLRGNAAAKRALWPQLRALRKRSRA